MQQQPERRDGGQDLLEQCARYRSLRRVPVIPPPGVPLRRHRFFGQWDKL